MTKCPIAHALNECQLTLGRVQQRQPQAGYTFTNTYEALAAARVELARLRAVPIAERKSSFAAGFICAGGETDEAKSQAEQFDSCVRAAP